MTINTILLLILIPVISSFIGWLTNYIAIQSLFKPKQKISILGFTYQGLLPKRHTIIARKIAKTVADHLISTEDIKEKIKTKKNIQTIKTKFKTIISSSFLENLPSFVKPMAEPVVDTVIEKKGEEIISHIIDGFIENIDSQIDIEKLIEEKLIEFEIGKLEEMVHSVAKEELKHIELLGAVIGFIVGIFQVLLFFILN